MIPSLVTTLVVVLMRAAAVTIVAGADSSLVFSIQFTVTLMFDLVVILFVMWRNEDDSCARTVPLQQPELFCTVN